MTSMNETLNFLVHSDKTDVDDAEFVEEKRKVVAALLKTAGIACEKAKTANELHSVIHQLTNSLEDAKRAMSREQLHRLPIPAFFKFALEGMGLGFDAGSLVGTVLSLPVIATSVVAGVGGGLVVGAGVGAGVTAYKMLKDKKK